MLIPEDVNLPLFNQDLEQSEPVLSEVMALQARFKAANGLVVSSPEYNGHVSPYLKNTIDWVSRLPRIDSRYAADDPFRGKPVLRRDNQDENPATIRMRMRRCWGDEGRA